MSLHFTPLLPRPSAEDSVTFSALESTVQFTPEPVQRSAAPVKDEMNSVPHPIEGSLLSEHNSTQQAAPVAMPHAFEPGNIRQASNDNNSQPMWPSEIHNMGDTTWLLPVQSDQSAALASILRTELQSHNITREMLHNTERRRLEGAQRCKQLQGDVESWAAAYNGLTATFSRCAEEFSRLATENVELKTKLNTIPINVPTFDNKLTGNSCCEFSNKWNNEQLSAFSTGVDFCQGRDTMYRTDGYESPCASEFSALAYSPEV